MIIKIRKSTTLFVIFLLVGISFASISGCANHFSKLDFDDDITKLMKQGRIPSLSACIIKNDNVVWYNPVISRPVLWIRSRISNCTLLSRASGFSSNSEDSFGMYFGIN